MQCMIMLGILLGTVCCPIGRGMVGLCLWMIEIGMLLCSMELTTSKIPPRIAGMRGVLFGGIRETLRMIVLLGIVEIRRGLRMVEEWVVC